jgi:hypothetical protein
MIFFFNSGRLGNQIFQYVGLKHFFPKHQIFFFGCSSLRNTFNISDTTFIFSNTSSFLYKVSKIILHYLIIFRLLGEIREIIVNNNTKLYVQRGLLRNIFIAHNIYFQYSSFLNTTFKSPTIKKKYLVFAKNWLKKKIAFQKKSNLVFVHIRRGDYFLFPHSNSPAVLDLRWYKKNMLNIKNRVKKTIFVIMGDDNLYIRNVFKESKSLIISNNLPEIDLSIMSLCSYGILSPSSFAWWGAFYGKNHNKKDNYFIAPKYWLGHRSKKWYPKNFFSKWITYVS